MKKLLIISIYMLVGCSTQASRMADCEAQGVTHDTCYLAEHNRQSALESVSEKQALENSAKQFGQAAKTIKPFDKRLEGIEVKRDSIGIVSIDGKPAAPGETTPTSTSYESGFFTAIIYSNGKVALLKDHIFLGFMK